MSRFRWPRCELAETLLQAPALLAAIPTQDWNALVACSRQLQHIIHASVQALTVTCASDISTLGHYSWPQLVLIQFPSDVNDFHSALDHLPSDPSLELIAAAAIYNLGCMKTITALIVRPPEEHGPPGWDIAAALLRLQKQWGPTRSSILGIRIRHEAEEVLEHLNKGQWSYVSDLILNSSSLDAAALQHMRKPVWPWLESLSLRCCNVDHDALGALKNKGWDQLFAVNLDDNPLNAPAVATIPNVFSNCSHLSLSKVTLGDASADPLMAMHADLSDLDLSFTEVSATAIAGLFSVRWCLLSHLNLSHNALATDAMASLASGNLPKLGHLDVSSNRIDVVAIQQLVEGEWPSLFQLILNNNKLDDAAVFMLKDNQWPNLQSLSLSGNEISAQGVSALKQCRWPELTVLTLDSSAATDAIAKLLNLDVIRMRAFQEPIKHSFMSRSPRLLDDWPQLSNVVFCTGLACRKCKDVQLCC